MTKEELKKEAKGYVKTIAFVYETEVVRKIVCMYAEQAYLASAEPREKRIVELEKENAELKAQIEKMKRCEICKEYTSGSCNYHFYSQQVCKENGMKLFKLKEIKEK